MAGCLVVGAVWGQALYLPSAYKSSFGDGLKVDKNKLGYYPTYADADNYSGMEYAQNRYRIGDWSTKGEQLTYVSKKRASQSATKNFAVGYNLLENGRSSWLLDGNYTLATDAETTVEMTVNRDRVEVQQSLTSDVLASSYNVSVERRLLSSLSLQLTKGETRYTDGNHRPLTKLKALYDVWPEQGVNLQLRSRYFRNTDTSVNSGYFNPYRFVEHIGAIEMNRTVSGWLMSGNVGYGRQAGGDDPKTLAKAFEFSATTPLADRVFIKAKAGYFRSLGYNGPDFIYRYVSEDVIVIF